ncbi:MULTISPECIES: RNA ligase [unclassified Thioalkalivibrio]|uniref:RNA ligase n=1 Tax=unclassified Thioalkalivibrio TaxID=2621013 RepID=UPI000370D7DB|nr:MULTISPECIES: RNA ligase [unclassified Thioalkalivibrio]
MIDHETLQDAVANRRAEALTFDGLEYARLLEPVNHYPRGSVVLPDGSIIPGYPAIGRIQSLEAGLPRQFDQPFWAEEKIDGFNVRILRWHGRIYAFSRGGYVCAFSTDRVTDFMDPVIFDAEPDLILCAEIAGPDTPYLEGSTPRVAHDVGLFVFDLMRLGQPGFVPQPEKFSLIEHHALPPAPLHGQFTPHDTQALGQLIRRLDEEGAEGLVLKTVDGQHRAKYVTGSSCISDIRVCSEQLLDLPPEYFTNRLTRLAIFLSEHPSRHHTDLEQILGDALLSGLYGAVGQHRRQGHVGHRYRCRFRERANALHFMNHMRATGGRHVAFADDAPRQEDGYWLLEFDRQFDRITGTLASALAGERQYD